MTDTAAAVDRADEARRARIDALAQRRAPSTVGAAPRSPSTSATPQTTPSTRSRARRQVGRASKAAVAGLGAATMLGIVAALGWAGRSVSADPAPVPVPAPAPVGPVPVVVVIHHADGSVVTGDVGTATSATSAGVVTDQPIVLSAQPVVRQAPVSAAPVGRTHGSR